MSTASDDKTFPGDLTAQARIRNAAIAEFASAGFAQAKVRDIAQSAGVSAALIIHHFGSKAGLREVCDQHVLDALLRRARDESRPSSVRSAIKDYMGDPSEFHVQVQYMVRAIDEDSPSADKFVLGLLTESEDLLSAGIADGTVRPTSDVRGMSVLTMLISLSLLTMPPAIARALGEDAASPDVMRRMALPSLELYTHGLYTDDSMLRSVQEALADSVPTDAPPADGEPADGEPGGPPGAAPQNRTNAQSSTIPRNGKKKK